MKIRVTVEREIGDDMVRLEYGINENYNDAKGMAKLFLGDSKAMLDEREGETDTVPYEPGDNDNLGTENGFKLKKIALKLLDSQAWLDKATRPSSHVGIDMANGWQTTLNEIGDIIHGHGRERNYVHGCNQFPGSAENNEKKSSVSKNSTALTDALLKLAEIQKIVDMMSTRLDNNQIATRHSSFVLGEWRAMISRLDTILIMIDDNKTISQSHDNTGHVKGEPSYADLMDIYRSIAALIVESETRLKKHCCPGMTDGYSIMQDWRDTLEKISLALSNDFEFITSSRHGSDKLFGQLEQIAVNVKKSGLKYAGYNCETLTSIVDVYSDWADLINHIEIILSPEFRAAAVSNERSLIDATAKLNKLANIEMRGRIERNRINKGLSADGSGVSLALIEWRTMLNEMKDVLNTDVNITVDKSFSLIEVTRQLGTAIVKLEKISDIEKKARNAHVNTGGAVDMVDWHTVLNELRSALDNE